MRKSVFYSCLLTAAATAALFSGVAFLMAKDMTTLKPYPVKSVITAEEMHYAAAIPSVDHGGTMNAYTGFYFGEGDGVVLQGVCNDVFVESDGIENYVYDPVGNHLTFQAGNYTFSCAMGVFEPQENANDILIWQNEDVSKYCLPVCINEAGDTFLVATEVKGAATKEQYAEIETQLIEMAKNIAISTSGSDTIKIGGLTIPIVNIESISPDYVVLRTNAPSYLSVTPVDKDEQADLYRIYECFVDAPFAMRYSESISDTATGYRPYVFCLDDLRFTLYARSLNDAKELAKAFANG